MEREGSCCEESALVHKLRAPPSPKATASEGGLSFYGLGCFCDTKFECVFVGAKTGMCDRLDLRYDTGNLGCDGFLLFGFRMRNVGVFGS